MECIYLYFFSFASIYFHFIGFNYYILVLLIEFLISFPNYFEDTRIISIIRNVTYFTFLYGVPMLLFFLISHYLSQIKDGYLYCEKKGLTYQNMLNKLYADNLINRYTENIRFDYSYSILTIDEKPNIYYSIVSKFFHYIKVFIYLIIKICYIITLKPIVSLFSSNSSLEEQIHRKCVVCSEKENEYCILPCLHLCILIYYYRFM